ncbi:zinc finger CCCH domain-containing protein 53 isoform X2 [Abrus precatorius]|uniref:Zinc finger CCCH domain-containing protein 53 isoform X2 n=1 Tax=Abrus precatorius TaxID=3816 RepID=A0A8B8LLM1_ABRPR|nr:zinc finger CCCH domain-containing protein 53 isoform X2 [Abrus precatorius]XP_027356279.1 zinc finger CCCH domain-containing protein 53 isoform X2 [Abrus precatorius]XP_027356280.1 zinc finger CCCH domain-containing protein 53 isoform X2 [Abrus precatorius]
MDGYEATRIVFSRIQNLDPENASKIMGVLLLQDHGEKEMIRLAFGPEAIVHSVIVKARKELGLPSNSPPTPSTPPSPSPFLSRQNSTSSRLSGINLPPAVTIPNPSSTSASWATMSDDLMSPNNLVVGSSTSSSSLPFYANGGSDPIDDFQLQDQLSFLNDGSPTSATLGHKNADLFYPSHSDLASSPTGAAADPTLFPSYGWGGSLHRRSCSVNDACLGSEDPNSGLGWKPCLYFARGYCKNGTSCRFLHGGLGDADGAAMVGSPSKIEMMEQCHELFRSKSAQQQRLAAASQLMASSLPYSPKCMNFLLQQQQQNDTQRAAAAALMMSEDLHKFGRSRLERNDFSLNSPGMVNPASRQIYLTFPADSTFREEDVSNYFSIYGPVQDVRIPYQQKRMFGFVTFVYPETVKLILSKGNPHFVCDARVLVKPYKEKGKVPDKKQQQQLDRADFSPCGTPTGLDARDQYDLQLGGRMFYNTHDMLWRRKLEEQADLQQALELQSRRLMGLQLLDIKKHHQRALSTGSPIPSPTHSPNMFHQNLVLPSFHGSSEAPEESGSSSAPASTASVSAGQQQVNISAGKEVVVNGESGCNEGNGKLNSSHEDRDLQECLEHNLPDSPFASPTKAAGDFIMAPFSNGPNEAIDSDPSAASANSKFGTNTLLPAASALDMGSFKSYNCQIPRFSSGHGTIGMFAGTGGAIGI